MKQCEFCHKDFEEGHGKQKYCSNSCKVKMFHSLRKQGLEKPQLVPLLENFGAKYGITLDFMAEVLREMIEMRSSSGQVEVKLTSKRPQKEVKSVPKAAPKPPKKKSWEEVHQEVEATAAKQENYSPATFVPARKTYMEYLKEAKALNPNDRPTREAFAKEVAATKLSPNQKEQIRSKIGAEYVKGS